MRPSLLSFNVRRTYHRFTYLIARSFYGWAARENVSFFDSFIARLSFCFQYVNVLSFLRVENNGFEPLTPCLQSRCSSQLS